MGYVNIRDTEYPFILRYVQDIIRYRHLCWNLVGSDLRSRFRRSRLGIIWAVIQPLAFSLVVAAVWGSVLGQSDYWSFGIYVFSGIILWEYFTNIIGLSQDALLNAEGHLRQTRIPFLIFQVRQPLTGMVILLCAAIGLLGLMAALSRLPEPGMHLLLVPAFFPVFLMFGIPLSIVMSVLGTQFRDLKHISTILISGMFFISPVMLGREILERPELEFLTYANPMVPFIDMFRAPLLDGRFWSTSEILTVSIWTSALWLAAIILSAKAGRRLVYAI